MTIPAIPMTRRAALGLCLSGLGALAMAPAALAAPGVSFPLRLAYVRVAPGGFVQIRSDEQAPWTGLATRMGGLIATFSPLQPGGMLGGGLPKIEGGANCALVARQMAANAGFNQLILYATHDGQSAPATYDNWFAGTFANLTRDMGKAGRATGEVHLLDVNGGMPLASAMADAAPRDPLNLFDGGRKPEREVLSQLIASMELRLQDMAREAYESQRSIAD
jgi:hypothetical protein